MGLRESEFEQVERWLTCIECIDGERTRVADLGGRTVPVLTDYMQILLPQTRDSSHLDALRIRYDQQYQGLGAPPMTVDEYIEEALDDYRATIQRRAILSLADLEAEEALQTTLDSVAAWGLRADVVRLARHGLERASGAVLSIIEIRVNPDPIGVAVGATVRPSYLFLDAHGNTLSLEDVDPTISVADPAVASFSEGHVSGEAPGITSLNVSAGAVSGSVSVHVIPEPRLLSVVSGDRQSGPPGMSLGDPVVVRAADDLGNVEPNVDVRWDVLEGGGGAPANSTTVADGSTSVTWVLGPTAGLNRLRATAFGGGSVTFFAVGTGAVPGVVPPTDHTAPPVPAGGGIVLNGTVSVEGAGVAGVDVVTTVGGGGPVATAGTTNAAGQFEFASLPGDSYEVSITGFPVDVEFQLSGIASSATTTTVDFAGRWTNHIHAYVFESGSPVRDVDAELRTSPGGLLLREGTTDPFGLVRFENLPPGDYEVLVPTLAGSSGVIELGGTETEVRVIQTIP